MSTKPKVTDPTVLEIGFLRTELQVGLTLSRLAVDAHHLDKAQRNRANARKAYDSVVHFMTRVSCTPDEAIEIKSKLSELKSALHGLGEKI